MIVFILVSLFLGTTRCHAKDCAVSSYSELCLAVADTAKDKDCATFVVRGGGDVAPPVCDVRRSVTIVCDDAVVPWVCDPSASCIRVSDVASAASLVVRGCRMLGKLSSCQTVR